MNPLRLVTEHRDAIVITLTSFVGSMLIATVVVQAGLRSFRAPDSASPRGTPSLGFWIGFFETILIFILVFQDEFGALAIVFAAKELVQRDKISKDPGYYLLGTLANVSIACLFALLAVHTVPPCVPAATGGQGSATCARSNAAPPNASPVPMDSTITGR